MTNLEKTQINKLINEGFSITKIADELKISANTIKSFIQRERKKQVEESNCLKCGKVIRVIPHRKKKLFCSNLCRKQWWNTHLFDVKRKAYYTFTCANCGKEFNAYGNNHRKYCSRGCFADARRKK